VNLRILSPDANGWIDPPVHDTLRQLPNLVTDVEPDAWLVPITYGSHFKFEGLAQIKGKKWVLVDYSEFGWDWKQDTSYKWLNGDRFKHPSFAHHEEYIKLQHFMLDNPPILTFQRELLERDRSDTLVPIEYLSWLPDDRGMDTKEQFLKRPLDVSYIWSRSHEERPKMHGAIFDCCGGWGYDVISEFSHVERALQESRSAKKWLSVHVPHYARIDVREVQKFVKMSKITISMPGCGVKCFRHGEVCQDAIMAMLKDELAWSYPWNYGNSIPICSSDIDERQITEISNSLENQDLYNIYIAAMENGRKYRSETYLRQWVMGNIQRVL